MVMMQINRANYNNLNNYNNYNYNKALGITFKSRNTVAKEATMKAIPFFAGLLALLNIKVNKKEAEDQKTVPVIESNVKEAVKNEKDLEVQKTVQVSGKDKAEYSVADKNIEKRGTKIEKMFEIETFPGDRVDRSHPHIVVKEIDNDNNIVRYRETGLAKDIIADSTSYYAELSNTAIKAEKDGDDVIYTYIEAPHRKNPEVRKFKYSDIKQLGLTNKEIIECLNTQPQIRRDLYADVFVCASQGKDFGDLLKKCYLQLPNQESEFTKIIRMANPIYVDKVPAQEALEKIYKYQNSKQV